MTETQTTPARLPRLLVIMGSGETAPTMTVPHRRVFERLAEATGDQINAVLLDTPFGFQENVNELQRKLPTIFGTLPEGKSRSPG